ncbi:hypothetical protein BN59_00905 [Legionella massiliensis]|uniref:Uncharacterized protein n=1 Tax=Legionella massiliensis TaxID=1034943 RepID=A0A078KUB6_9GAMM|nr:hypothetical protein [Legionella massiliensis]CDZ76631.1 hypothetical protein BN59_00905 [Legionella massiliensis]CEE12369.1 hypothetical protein BN1094_00905 [Legionella massiliensis]
MNKRDENIINPDLFWDFTNQHCRQILQSYLDENNTMLGEINSALS